MFSNRRLQWPMAIICVALAGAVFAAKARAQQDAESGLSLRHAQQLLLTGNHEVLAARLASRAAHADVITAGEAPNPQLSFNSSGADIKNGIGPGYAWDKRLDSVLRIDQLFERGGKRNLRAKAANNTAAAADFDTSDVLRSAMQAVADAYYDLRFAQEAQTSYMTLLDFERQSLSATEARQRAGDASAIDVSRLRIEVARAEADLLRAQQVTREAQISLSELLGMTGDSTVLRATDDWPEIIATAAMRATSDGAQLVGRRPDVQAAQQRFDAATQNFELAKSQRTRDITVGFQYEHDLTQPQPVNSLGVGISVPLFLRNRYEGEIARAQADRESAAEVLDHTKLNAQHEIEQAAAELELAAQRLQTYQSEVVNDAQASADAAEYAYRRGALSLTDLLDARRAFQAVKLDSLDAHNAYAKALAGWRAATAANVINDQFPSSVQ